MANKNILITGASSGIGKEVAIYLSEKGATVILVGRNVVRLEEVASDIGKNVYIYPCNLCETGQIERILNFIRWYGSFSRNSGTDACSHDDDGKS